MTAQATAFDPESHTYTIGGRRVPSVTDVLSDLLPCWQASEWYLERGRAVHACAAMIGRGQEFEHDPQILGQVQALQRFWAEVKPELPVVEMQVYSQRYLYGGTLDLVATMGIKRVVIDYKASSSPATVYQLAAYSLAYEEMGGMSVPWGCEVVITEDGYKMGAMVNLNRARREWLMLLAAHKIRQRWGVANDYHTERAGSTGKGMDPTVDRGDVGIAGDAPPVTTHEAPRGETGPRLRPEMMRRGVTFPGISNAEPEPRRACEP